MKPLGWGLAMAAVLLLGFVVTHGGVTWLALLGVGSVFAVGIAIALGSQLVTVARRVAYAIREVRSAAKGEPEPPPPAPDLMATMRTPMKAVPKPPEAP